MVKLCSVVIFALTLLTRGVRDPHTLHRAGKLTCWSNRPCFCMNDVLVLMIEISLWCIIAVLPASEAVVVVVVHQFSWRVLTHLFLRAISRAHWVNTLLPKGMWLTETQFRDQCCEISQMLTKQTTLFLFCATRIAYLGFKDGADKAFELNGRGRDSGRRGGGRFNSGGRGGWSWIQQTQFHFPR